MINIYHLIGIKGTGMSALAKVLDDLGYKVKGSDYSEHYFTEDSLKERSIEIMPFSKKNIDQESKVYIVSSCYNERFEEVEEVINRKYPLFYYHQFLATFFKGTYIGVAGTHGKTTTTTLIDGLTKTLKKAVIIGDGTGYACCDYDTFLFEACEYKVHFLEYHYDYLVINNIDLDHLDYYKDIDEVIEAFQKAADNAKMIIINNDDINCKKIKHNNKITFGLNSSSTIKGKVLKTTKNGFILEVRIKKDKYIFNLPFTGIHMIYNFLASVAVCYMLGQDLNGINDDISKIKLPKRRMNEYITPYNVIIDDYAHHPTEIKACFEAIKQKYPTKRLIVIFQPHTYTRTIKLSDKFKAVFDCVDTLYLENTFTSKREKKNEQLDDIVKNIFTKAITLDKAAIDLLKTTDAVIVLLGAGVVDKYISVLT